MRQGTNPSQWIWRTTDYIFMRQGTNRSQWIWRTADQIFYETGYKPKYVNSKNNGYKFLRVESFQFKTIRSKTLGQPYVNSRYSKIGCRWIPVSTGVRESNCYFFASSMRLLTWLDPNLHARFTPLKLSLPEINSIMITIQEVLLLQNMKEL